MKKFSRLIAFILLVLVFILPAMARAQSGGQIDVLTVNGVIDTWVEGYIKRGISVAEQDGAQAIVIVLNTPGGSLGAMQNILTAMLNTRVPTIVFVYPQGAAAGSAGTFITLAGNIAAMAPNTTIGAAHPVEGSGENIEGDMRDKVTNFSVAMIQNIARTRGRNEEWAANAVKSSVAATAQEALDLKVIDLMANDLPDLLKKIDGKNVKTVAGEITLQTLRARTNPVDMNFAEIFLHTLVDPTIALILLQIGLLAIAVELYNPGATIPAVVGGICLVLAFVALGNLPVNWGGVILIVLSVAFFILDLKVTGFALTIGGFVMFILGALLLFTPFTPPSPSLPEFERVEVSPVVIVLLGSLMVGFFVLLLGAAVRARKYPVLSGAESLVGATGIALSDLAPSGLVRVKSEEWSAEALDGSIKQGDPVQVVKIEGLRLQVTKK
jgi:membrane-bound serine protease (ClpP class)